MPVTFPSLWLMRKREKTGPQIMRDIKRDLAKRKKKGQKARTRLKEHNYYHKRTDKIKKKRNIGTATGTQGSGHSSRGPAENNDSAPVQEEQNTG